MEKIKVIAIDWPKVTPRITTKTIICGPWRAKNLGNS